MGFEFRRSKRSVSLDDTDGMMRLLRISDGVNVTEEGALALSTVYSCVRVIAEGVASLPYHTYSKTKEGAEVAAKHPTYKLVHSEPNPHMTSFMFREALMTHVLLWGNGYAWIERDGANRPEAFWLLKPWEVSVLEYEGKIYYQTKHGVIPAYDIIHVAGLGFNGISGKSPIRLQAEQLGTNLRAQHFGASFFENGATLGGLLTTDQKLTPDQRTQIKNSWYGDAHGAKNNHSTKVLEGGLHYERVGVPPEEAQYLQTRQMGNVEICGMYRVPPHMVGILDRATFSNIEHQDIGFVKYTLMPWLTRFEQEFNRKILRDGEKDKFFTGFNVNGLLKGDITAQTTHIREMMDRGVYSINNALSFLGQNSIGPEGERRLVMRNMVPLDRVDDTINQETNNGEGNTQL